MDHVLGVTRRALTFLRSSTYCLLDATVLQSFRGMFITTAAVESLLKGTREKRKKQ